MLRSSTPTKNVIELNGEIIEIEDDDIPPTINPKGRNLSMINKGTQCNLIRKRQYIPKIQVIKI